MGGKLVSHPGLDLCAKDMKHKQEEQAAAERRMRQSPRSNF